MADNPLSLSLKARIKILEQENVDLKRQIQTLSKMIPQSAIADVADEQIICEIEIRRLRDIALSRSLNLEETKKLDILMKNLKIIKETTNDNIIEIKKAMDVSLSDLMEIASNDEQTRQIESTSETGSDS